MLKTAKNVLRRFRQEDDAVVAIQVVIFSVMLLTSTGLVIDFGRAYSAHSQMQSFVDKAALAAANELDGQPDAMTRATNAALAVSQSSSFTFGESEFSVQQPLTFLSANPSDATGAFSEDALRAFATQSAEEATHVFVQADARTIKLAFLSIGLSGVTQTDGRTDQVRRQLIEEGTQFFDSDGNPINQIDDDVRQSLSDATDGTGELNMPTEMQLSAFAVARMQVSYCGEISTMVMCNPFENDARSFADIMDGQEGAVFRLTSDRDGQNNPMPLSTSSSNPNDDAIRVGLLKNPIDEIGGDPEGVCSDGNLERVFGLNPANTDNGGAGSIASSWQYPGSNSDADLERLRDMCLLATIEPQLQCLSGDVIVKAAEPETITTSLNTLFDLWDAPMDRVLALPVTSDRDFAPDYVAPHGMLTRVEYETEFVSATAAAELQAEVDDALARVNHYIASMEAEEAAGNEARADRWRDRLYGTSTRAGAIELLDGAYANQTAFLLQEGVYPDQIANSASRRNYLARRDGTHKTWGPMLTPSCLTAANGANCSVNNPNIAMPEVLSSYGEPINGPTLLGENVSVDGYFDPIPVPVLNEEGEQQFDNDGNPLINAVPYSEFWSDGVTVMSRGNSPDEDRIGWTLVNNTDSYQDGVLIQSATGRDFDFRVEPRSIREVEMPAVESSSADPDPSQAITVRWRNGTTVPGSVDNTVAWATIGGDPEVVDLTYIVSFAEYAQGYYQPILNSLSTDLSNPSTTLEWDIALAQTMYEGYALVERQYEDFLDSSLSSGPASNSSLTNTLPMHYQFASNNVRAEQPQERRRQRVAVINCSVMDSVPAASDDLNTYAGSYVSELEAVIDVFYTRPVEVAECEPGTTSDQVTLSRDITMASARDAWEAAGNVWDADKQAEWLAEVWQPALDSVGTLDDPNAAGDCWNEDIDVAHIYAEFVGISDPLEENSEDFRSYAVLVH
ncbi:TadE/TadG family type IV pilus assembly protein [Pontivivens ytuae]|uniref:Putative Flp pilus-assembly TadG-like N-terminal domain-containing protein n=1 Tax=Pontivivens ytuae TaxID=2789856 RepID=A0A7S9LPJ3_9RHOB|nr:Tad domain-containing protein [Pontivivens ytuae]QPH52899.1 hypothetical protein I0K15_13920 [Pontivivens ytuae]